MVTIIIIINPKSRKKAEKSRKKSRKKSKKSRKKPKNQKKYKLIKYKYYFISKYYYIKSMVFHNCPICGVKFIKKSRLNEHINKKFKCKPIENNEIINIKNKVIPDTNNNNSIQDVPKLIQDIPNLIQDIPSLFETKLSENLLNNNNNNNNISNLNDTSNNLEIDNLLTNNILNNDYGNKDNSFCCGYCLKSYSTKSNLNKHLNTSCKVKQEKDAEKENIFKLLLEKDNENKEFKEIIKEQTVIIKEHKEKLNQHNEIITQILQQNQILIKELKNLKKEKITKLPNTKNINSHNTNTINSTTNTTNTTNTNTTNTQNNNIVMFNFGKEDLGIIDKQIYIDRVVKKPITGVKIPEEILKIIHFNHQYPQLSNIYISDINREKCMIWEDGEWKLSPVDKIPEVIDKVVNYSNGVETELREKFINNKKVNERLDIVNKYIKMNDSDYVEELKLDQDDNNEDNKDVIKRCEGFQKLTYDTFKTTLYNEGKNIKKSIKN
jgi:hypothetical protein